MGVPATTGNPTTSSVSARLVVVGSINLDLVVRSAQLPRPGETVIGRSLHQSLGGKGANQAVAAARLGGQVHMIGRLGDDHYATLLRTGLAREAVDLRAVMISEHTSSGLAIVAVDDAGENAITVIAGANGDVTADDLRAASDMIVSADVLLVQLEIPLPAVIAALEIARTSRKCLTILDPAPAPHEVPAGLLEVDFLVPNETEAARLVGWELIDAATEEHAARRLIELGAKQVVITLGSRGVLWCDTTSICERIPPFVVESRDSTAAGDGFAGGLGVALAELSAAERGDRQALRSAIRWASAVGAIVASREGAQAAMPTRDEVVALMARQPHELSNP